MSAADPTRRLYRVKAGHAVRRETGALLGPLSIFQPTGAELASLNEHLEETELVELPKRAELLEEKRLEDAPAKPKRKRKQKELEPDDA